MTLNEYKQYRKNLSKTELRILPYLVQGYSNQKIADTLGISKRTVESHVSHILGKTSLKNRTQIAYWEGQYLMETSNEEK